jgi:hypothetical protein
MKRKYFPDQDPIGKRILVQKIIPGKTQLGPSETAAAEVATVGAVAKRISVGEVGASYTNHGE